jgi:hypothetical protein
VPAPRGRRGHPLLDEIPGLRDKVEELFQQTPRLTIDGLREELKGTGFWKKLQELGHNNGIARGTLCDERLKFEAAKARRELTLLVAEAYNAGEFDILEIDTAISGMLSVEISAELKDIFDGGEGLTAKAIELANLFEGQARAHAGIERAKTYVNRGAKKAEGYILAHVLEVLKGVDAPLRKTMLDAIRTGAKEAQK